MRSLNSRIGTDNEILKRPCKVYDVKETDPTKKNILNFSSLIEASEALGISVSHISYIIRNKSRNHKNKLNKTITIR